MTVDKFNLEKEKYVQASNIRKQAYYIGTMSYF